MTVTVEQEEFSEKMTKLDWDIYGKFFALMKFQAQSKLASDGSFTADDIREFDLTVRMTDVAHQLGALIRRWEVEGLIEKTGKFLCSRIPSNHSRRIAQYRLTEWNKE